MADVNLQTEITDIVDLPTAETDTSLVMAPGSAGGVEFRAETGGGGGSVAGETILTRAATQSIANSTWTDVAWDTELKDDLSAHAGSSADVTVQPGSPRSG